jgi:polyprenyl-phospho-N-acetylgalactosaminyl synthase
MRLFGANLFVRRKNQVRKNKILMIFIVVPVYNENPTVVRKTVTDLLQAAFNVVLVDDASQNRIKEQLCDLPIHFLQHAINLGQGAALQTGTEYALTKNASVIAHFDADGQHHTKSLMSLIKSLNLNIDIVLGSRFLASTPNHMPVLKKSLLRIATIVNFLFTGVLLTDAHNGMRAMNRKAASVIKLKENRFAHATELLSEIKKNKLRYLEVPVEISYSNYSLGKGQKTSNAFTIVVDLILRKVFKKS